MKCTKAIIPVAGYGTRRLPITKIIEKSMLPILNRPVIDYIVEDCVKAGITDIYLVVNKRSTQIRDYFTAMPAFEHYLQEKGRGDMVGLVRPPHDVQFHFIEQDTSVDAKHGTVIPVWLCRDYVEPDEHVLVLMGDDFLYNTDGSSDLTRLIAEVETAGSGSALLGVRVPLESVSKYGVIATHEQDGRQIFDHIQEKPAVEEAKSNLINISKYLFDATFFTYLDQAVTRDTNGKEYFITDPINEYVDNGNKLYVVPAKGQYLDSGTLENWLFANNFIAKHQV